MSEWEYKACRRVSDDLCPGRRVCHLDIRCCTCSLNEIKKSNAERGRYFEGQLTGEESLYHTLGIVDAQQRMANEIGEEKFLQSMKAFGEDRKPVEGPSTAGNFGLKALVEKKAKLVQDGNVYGEKKTQDEFEKIISDAVKTERERSEIYLLVKNESLSVKEMSKRLGLDPQRVLNHLVAMRRDGAVAIGRVEGTSPLYIALKVNDG